MTTLNQDLAPEEWKRLAEIQHEKNSEGGLNPEFEEDYRNIYEKLWDRVDPNEVLEEHSEITVCRKNSERYGAFTEKVSGVIENWFEVEDESYVQVLHNLQTNNDLAYTEDNTAYISARISFVVNETNSWLEPCNTSHSYPIIGSNLTLDKHKAVEELKARYEGEKPKANAV